MLSDSALLTFKAICNFIICLDEYMGDTHRPIRLYAHLLKKTTIANEVPILKHIECFKTFCVSNSESIYTKNINKLEVTNITYSQKVYLNISQIYQDADPDAKNIIWKHLLTISALVDPTGKAKQILSTKEKSGDEEDFLKNIIGKVEEHVDPNANPMEAVSSIMQSGIFSELVGGMGNGLENGTLDLGKLMGTVQNMVGTLNDQAQKENGQNVDPSIDMINTMMGTLDQTIKAKENGETPPPPPDLSKMLGMMGPMMQEAMNAGESGNDIPSTGNKIEDHINKQLQLAKTNNKFPPTPSNEQNE